MKCLRYILLLALVAAPRFVAAQQGNPPLNPEDVRSQLQQPGAADAIRDRIRQSGLTQDQIRARLQASGYASNLLDKFLQEGAVGDTAAPGGDQLAAITALGLAPTTSTRPVAGRPDSTDLGRASIARSRNFGVDVFRRSTTQFLPLFTGPVPPDYRLGPGDVPVLILTGDVERAQPLPITREGFVVIPAVGQVQLSNLTLAQAKDVLFQRLRRVYSSLGREPDSPTRFDLTVSNVRAVTVFVIGEVVQPGAYQLSALSTALTSLYAAGGITEQGNLRGVQIRRRGEAAPQAFDVYDYLLRGDTRKDVRLNDGDVIFVPPRSRRIVVAGAVVRPMIYDIDSTETLAEAIANAGGLLPEAAVSRISVDRIVPTADRRGDGPQRMAIDVPLSAGSRQVSPLPLVDGDSIFVHSVGTDRGGYVVMKGAVRIPGRVGLTSGLTLSRLIALSGGLDVATYNGRAHIERLQLPDSTRRLISVPLPAGPDAAWTEDPALQEYDIVTVYSRPEMRKELTVSITGMVNDPTTVPWREGMTLRDLVLIAKGLRQGALLEYAEMARLPVDRSAGQLAVTSRVPLDSTYLFDRNADGTVLGPRGLGAPRSGAAEVVLQPYDNVLILRQPDFELQRRVIVTGQVRFPGTYVLTNKNERLASLIRRAGGLTDQAFADGVRFYRRQSDVGRVDIDLTNALRRPDSRDNVILQPADSIDVPEYQPAVRVMGAVNSPGSVLWVKGKNIDYYIGAAGGLAANADPQRASARRANGSTRTRGSGFLFFGGSVPDPGPGGEVFVPVEPAKLAKDNTALYAALASIIASTATIIVSLTR